MSKTVNRLWELDFLRGVAILLMVFFHLMYDLHEFYNLPIHYQEGFIFLTGKASATLFILLAGVSCSLSKSNLKRGRNLLFIAILLTIITMIAVPGSNIIFGILHFLAISILLYPIFHRWSPGILMVFGTIIIGLQYFTALLTPSTNLLFPLGFISKDFFSVDYYPLIPYLGLFLYGIALGKLLYPDKKSRFFYWSFAKPLILLGQHSLFIYLTHQPILLLLLYLFFK
ncbi:heparan-alpha-glucosaminide N-acetyltransferase [Desulforamulus reducens]|nr:heparan-alpha-glucosaminide N-acetyltransferase [Desulforamulus reducens]